MGVSPKLARLVALAIMLPASHAYAPPPDAAPPINPPGSAIAPQGTTLVQMWSEQISLDATQIPVQVTARFRMRNTSLSAESMDVRFPLQHPYTDNLGGYEGEIDDFTVFVDAIETPTEELLEPVSLNDNRPPILWATFPVTFPPGKDVLIQARYSVYPSSAPVSTIHALNYVLETGAGWHGPIELVQLAVTLPYQATLENVRTGLLDEAIWRHPRWSGPTLEWTVWHVEPTPKDNFQLWIVPTELWTEVLQARQAASRVGRTAADFVRLSQAYFSVGSDHKTNACHSPICRLALQAAEAVIRLFPSSGDALAQRAWMRFVLASHGSDWPILFPRTDEDKARLLDLQCEIIRALDLDPTSATARQLREWTGAGEATQECRARDASLTPAP